jgi:hypothetical protein
MLIGTYAILSLRKQYVTQAKRLRQTGGGLKDREDSDENPTDFENYDLNIHMDFYIPPDGPSEETGERAKNLWGA